MHGEVLANTICGKRTKYERGIWFNSAKFLDIEYQTYGTVPPFWVESEFTSFYWEHNSGKVAFRMLIKKDGSIYGVNNFGFRLKHEYFDKAIKENWKASKVIETLEKANFDPEFFAPFYIEIQKAYNSQFGTKIRVGKKSFIQKLFGASVLN